MMGNANGIDLLIKAGEYIKYSEAAKKRGEIPVDCYAYFTKSFLAKSLTGDDDWGNSSCASLSGDEKSGHLRKKGAPHKEVHNKHEKHRRAIQKQCLVKLRHVLPEITEEKVSKVALLRKAKQVIQRLRNSNAHLKNIGCVLRKQQRRLQKTLKYLKREIVILRSRGYGSDGETTSTASERDDESSDESIMDQIIEVRVNGNGTKDYHLTGTPRPVCLVPSRGGRSVPNQVCGNYEQGSILHARLSEDTPDIFKDMNEARSSSNKSPEKNMQPLDMSLGNNAQLDRGEKSELPAKKECATFQKAEFLPRECPRRKSDPLLLDMSSRLNTPLECSEKSKLQNKRDATFQKADSFPKVAGLNAQRDPGERSQLQVKKENATIKTNLPFQQREIQKMRSEAHPQPLGSQCQEQSSFEKDITLNAVCEEPRQTIANHVGEMLAYENELKLNSKNPVAVHTSQDSNIRSWSTGSLNHFIESRKRENETVIKSLSSRTIKVLCPPLGTPSVIQNGGHSLLKTIQVSPQVALRSHSTTSYTNNCAQLPVKSSEGKSFSVVSQVKRNVSAVPILFVSSSLAAAGLQLPYPTTKEACSPANELSPSSIISNSKQEHCSQALPNLGPWQPYSKIYVKK